MAMMMLLGVPSPYYGSWDRREPSFGECQLASMSRIQGSESGGHGCGPTSTLCFVPETIDALRANGAGNIPVLAAGGIADGRQVYPPSIFTHPSHVHH